MHEALSDLYSLTTDRQQSDSLPATFAQRDDFPGIPDDVWDDVVKYLHDHGGYTPEMLSADEVLSLISATHSTLMKSVSKGLSHEVSPELTSALEENTFIFSGFKTHAELKEASLLLRGEDGGLKSFEQFKRDVQSINETYNVQYLRAEYSYAEASAHVAMKWKDWEKGGRNYMLQYRTANDDRVRDSHRLLHNTTLPMDDPFWNSYIPPLGWRCRCNVVRVPADEYEQSNSELAQSIGEAATDLPKQRIFRFNPGKTLKVFPPKHPYMPKGCGDCDKNLRLAYDPQSELCRACRAIATCIKEHDVVNIERLTTYPNGGSVNVYKMITERESDDFKRIRQTAEFFASKGETVTITPRFHSADRCEDYYKVYTGIDIQYKGKCPDLKVGAIFYEHEGFTSAKPKKALKNMLAHGLEQSDRIVIERPDLTDKYIMDRISDKLKEGVRVSEVWLKEGNNLRLLYKKSTP